MGRGQPGKPPLTRVMPRHKSCAPANRPAQELFPVKRVTPHGTRVIARQAARHKITAVKPVALIERPRPNAPGCPRRTYAPEPHIIGPRSVCLPLTCLFSPGPPFARAALTPRTNRPGSRLPPGRAHPACEPPWLPPPSCQCSPRVRTALAPRPHPARPRCCLRPTVALAQRTARPGRPRCCPRPTCLCLSAENGGRS